MKASNLTIFSPRFQQASQPVAERVAHGRLVVVQKLFLIPN